MGIFLNLNKPVCIPGMSLLGALEPPLKVNIRGAVFLSPCLCVRCLGTCCNFLLHGKRRVLVFLWIKAINRHRRDWICLAT